jgi:hypothetical protein
MFGQSCASCVVIGRDWQPDPLREEVLNRDIL